MKKLINDPEGVVREELSGVSLAHRDLVRVNIDPHHVVRADAPVQGKVALVSGGGSGHEPMHGGFVGRGMLDAACPGEVFTSPTPDQMEAATKAVNGGGGVVHIVKNYTGDVMNFEMAAELCRSEGIDVESVLVDDDVAVQDSLYTAGRRGVGTTVLMEKIGGAAAEERRPLKEVADICRKVNDNGRSMGMALTSCTVPAAGKPTFELGDDEMEIGIGIHAEEDEGQAGSRHRGADGDPDPRRPPVQERGPGPRLRERDGRHAADRALHRVQRAGGDSRQPGDHDLPQPDRLLHHVARDAGVLDHVAEARRRADRAVGRPGAHSRAPLGRVKMGTTEGAATSSPPFRPEVMRERWS
jgi:hypothetical protein